MADIKYLISVDEKGAVTSVKNFEGVLGDLEKTSGKAKTAHGGLWKDVALGQFAYDAARKAGRMFVDLIQDSVGAAMEAEQADSALASALLTTGRNVDTILPGLREFASEIQDQTVYEDDAVKSAMALATQLGKNLNENGIKAVTRGAVGMASVFKIDLQSAVRAVSLGYEGNYTALGRMIPEIRNAKTEGEKQTAMMGFLEKAYQRAKDETNTFAGSLKQLGNSWGELKETVGNAIIQNQSVKDAIKGVKTEVDKLSKSDDFKLWLSAAVDLLVKAGKAAGTFAGMCKTMTEDIFGATRAEADLKESTWKLQDALERAEKAGHNFNQRQQESKDNAEKVRAALEAEKKKADELTLAVRQHVEIVQNKFIPTGQKTKYVIDALVDALARENAEIVNTAIPAARDMTAVLQAMGLEGFAPLPGAAEESTSVVSQAFSGLYNDIAEGWGDTVEEWLSGGTTFKEFMGGIFGNIKDSFFRMGGEMVTGWTLGFIKDLVTKTDQGSTAAAASITGKLGTAVTGVGGAISSLASGVATILPTIARAIASAAQILAAAAPQIAIVLGIALAAYAAFAAISKLLGASKQTDVTYWLKPISERAQEIRDWLFANCQDKLNFYATAFGNIGEWMNDQHDTMKDVGYNVLPGHLSLMESYLREIQKNTGSSADSLKRLAPVKAASGFEGLVTSPRLFLAGEGGPERVSIAPVSAGGRSCAGGGGTPAGVGQPIMLSIPIYLGTRLIQNEVIEIVNTGSHLGLVKLSPKAIATGR